MPSPHLRVSLSPVLPVSRVVVCGQKSEHFRTTDRARATRGWAAALGCLLVGVLDRPLGFAAHAVAEHLGTDLIACGRCRLDGGPRHSRRLSAGRRRGSRLSRGRGRLSRAGLARRLRVYWLGFCVRRKCVRRRELWRCRGILILALAQTGPDEPAHDGSQRKPEDSFGHNRLHLALAIEVHRKGAQLSYHRNRVRWGGGGRAQCCVRRGRPHCAIG